MKIDIIMEKNGFCFLELHSLSVGAGPPIIVIGTIPIKPLFNNKNNTFKRTIYFYPIDISNFSINQTIPN